MARILLRLVLVLVVLVGVAAGGTLYYAYTEFERPGPTISADQTDQVILFERGVGLNTIARRLENAGLIRNHFIFRAGVMWNGAAADLKAGEYAVPAGSSMRQIMELLRAGKSILHKLTIPEGLTSAQVAKLVDENEVLIGDTPPVPSEGSLLPETYLFTRGETKKQLIGRMADAQRELLTTLWEARSDDLPFNSVEAAVILASIVEKESSILDEQPKVASVFVNRLRRGMRLQSDPTIIYGLTGGEPLGRGIRQSELKKATPYNTYIIDGLPPSPIANPGKGALEAVFNPSATKYLYFVADGTGGHVFSESLRQHNRNVSKWRKIERERAKNQ